MTCPAESTTFTADRTPSSDGARVVVITGASSGIGRAAARAFAARGDRLVLAARRVGELQRTLDLCGGAGRVVECDVADAAQVRALADSVERTEGACHVLVNNAGVGARMAFDDAAAVEVLEHVMTVNFFGAARATHALLPLLRRSSPSAIVNVSSVAGLVGAPNAAAYCASKFALTGFGESLHAALATQGVQVATVHPGPVVTEGWPHTALRARRGSGLLVAPLDDAARAIVRASEPGAHPARVVPRVYRLMVLGRALSPRMHHWLLRRTAHRLPAREPHRAVGSG